MRSEAASCHGALATAAMVLSACRCQFFGGCRQISVGRPGLITWSSPMRRHAAPWRRRAGCRGGGTPCGRESKVVRPRTGGPPRRFRNAYKTPPTCRGAACKRRTSTLATVIVLRRIRFRRPSSRSKRRLPRDNSRRPYDKSGESVRRGGCPGWSEFKPRARRFAQPVRDHRVRAAAPVSKGAQDSELRHVCRVLANGRQAERPIIGLETNR